MRLKIPSGVHEFLVEAAAAAPVRVELPTEDRASYLLRYSTAVKNESAINSLDTPTSPFGDFAHIRLRQEENCLIVTPERELHLTPLMAFLAGAVGAIETYEIPDYSTVVSFRSGLSNAKKKLLRTIDNPEHVEAVYLTTAYIDGRVVRFFRPSRDGLKFSSIFSDKIPE